MTGRRLMALPAVLLLLILASAVGWLAVYGFITLIRLIL